MEVSLLSNEVSDLCIGRPALRTIPITATVAVALSALKRYGESYLSVWSCASRRHCNHNEVQEEEGDGLSRCVGKICIGDVVCFLASPDNLLDPVAALQSPVSVLLSKSNVIVQHLEPHASLLDAIKLMLEGTQNIVIPLHTELSNWRKKLLHKPSYSLTLHNNLQYCWITQEDIVRYLINSIGAFNPIPSQPINILNIIDSDNILAVHYDDPALSTLPVITEAFLKHTSVAIVDSERKLVGEISPCVLNSCDETVAAAIATLSAGDLMAYIDCGGPPEELVRLVKKNLEAKNLGTFLDLMDEESLSSSSSSSSSDDEVSSGKSIRMGGYSSRVSRRSEATVCYPWSSLIAVMIQTLSRRVGYVWVVEEDGTLTGIVTFAAMLKVFRDHLHFEGRGFI